MELVCLLRLGESDRSIAVCLGRGRRSRGWCVGRCQQRRCSTVCLLLMLWDDLQSLATVEAVGVEMRVEGEDAREVALLGQGDQAGIGQIHRCILILPHERLHAA